MKKHNIREYRELIQFLRGSGKTSLVIDGIQKALDEEESCLIIIANQPTIREAHYLYNLNIPEGARYKFLSVDNALTFIKETGQSIRQYHVAGFPQFDRVFIDPEIYETLIFDLTDRLESLYNKVNSCIMGEQCL